MAKNLFKRYVWLIETIGRFERLAFSEISYLWSKCSLSDGSRLPERTFHNHRKDIEDNFDIKIVCDRSDNVYYIENDISNGKANVSNYLLELISTQRLLTDSKQLDDRLSLEDIPDNNTKFLPQIAEAIINTSVVEIDYNSFWGSPGLKCVQPYMLKLFKRRWYLVAEHNDIIKLFVISKINDLRIINEKFSVPDSFCASTYFYNSFGIEYDLAIKPEVVKCNLLLSLASLRHMNL